MIGIFNYLIGRYWIGWQDGDYGKLYWTGDGWSTQACDAKRFYRNPFN